MIKLSRDNAYEILTAVVLDFDDVRDGFKPGSFEALLDCACQVVGERSAIKSDGRAKNILSRARTAAIEHGLYGADPVPPAQAALVELRSAFNSPLKKALLTGFHSTAKHIAAKAVSPSSETMRTI